MAKFMAVGRVITVDEEIAFVEELVDRDQVEHMIQVVADKHGRVHVSTMGSPLPDVKRALATALRSVQAIIEKGG